jgi:hypothetical protein
MKSNIEELFSVYSSAFHAGIPKLIGLELMALIIILGVYFAVNSKRRLYDDLHFLGSLRTLVVLVPSIILSVPFGMITIYKGIGALVVIFILLWVLTTEFIVRWLIGLLIGLIAGFISWFICNKIAPQNNLVYLGIPCLIAFATMIATQVYLSNSSWLGVRCPHCSTRGSVNTRQIGKQFLGSTSEHENNNGTTRITTYNKYLITMENSCVSCSQTWVTTSETKERSN